MHARLTLPTSGDLLFRAKDLFVAAIAARFHRGLRARARDTASAPATCRGAKVSTAAKGSIPTTLGGKLPPISVLSRRQFGLRVLRK
jgi:hypothetical protein